MTIIDDATSASAYPLSSGYKTEDAFTQSRASARRIDRDRERLMSAFVGIAELAIRDGDLTIDHCAERLREHPLYTRPLATRLKHMGVIVYGPPQTSPTCGRLAATIRPADDLVAYVDTEIEDESGLLAAIRSFIEQRHEAILAERRKGSGIAAAIGNRRDRDGDVLSNPSG